MPNARVEAFAPATVANIGVGFDILGLALEAPGDRVIAEYRDELGAVITRIEGDGGKLPLNPAKNTATVAANYVLNKIGVKTGASLTLMKDLPLASGMGSSAASAVAGALAVNALYGNPLSRAELLPACVEGEAVVSGYHADNVAPSLLGGITLIGGTDFNQIQQLPIPSNMFLALVTPDVAVPTSEARAVLPKMISLHDMVVQTAGVAQLIDGIYRNDLRAIAAAMESDCVVEPARAHLMPKMLEIREVAKANGALCLVISGAGPTLCAVCESETISQKVADAMGEVYKSIGMGNVTRTTRISTEGAKIIG